VNKNASFVLRALRLAFAFLTVIPVRFDDGAPTEQELAASRYGFPCVGLVIGLLMAALSDLLVFARVEPWPAAALLLVALALISGVLHLDGLADSCDGLFMPRANAQRRLDVMRDPHVGSFGATGIALLLIAKHSALVSLSGSGRTLGVFAAVAVSRTLVLVAAGLAESARSDGTGRVFIQATTERDAVGSALLACVLGAGIVGLRGFLAAVAAFAVTFALTRFSQSRLEGVTGDILGAAVELSETTFLLALVILTGLFEPMTPG
jgi:adenosylcobinamide-GDP ribazoletransferase